jgi:hypothetical protein
MNLLKEQAARLISEAQAAWNEVWQGYPDHWSKVCGTLDQARDLLAETAYDAYCNERKLSIELDIQSDRFRKSMQNKEMYRPPFEKLAAMALNLAAGKEVISDKSVMPTQLCYDCAVKHLADAATAWKEMEGGNKTSVFEVLGNLSHASNHLVERHPELASDIRNERKSVWEALATPNKPFSRPNFNALIESVFAAAGHEKTLEESRLATLAEADRLMRERKIVL